MRKTLILAVTLFAAFTIAVGQSDYKLLELVYLKPIRGADMDAATKAMAEHNKKYHSEAPFKASVWSNVTGSHVGTICWSMYPATFKQYDERKDVDAHDKDWDKNISPYFDIVAHEFWKEDDDLSYWPEDFKMTKRLIWTVFDIKPGDGYRFKALLKNIKEVYEKKNYKHAFTVYWNRFDNRDGRDVAIEVDFEKWAFLDEDMNFKKDYEEVHGEGSWWKAIEEYRDVVVSAEDELSEEITSMSGQ